MSFKNLKTKATATGKLEDNELNPVIKEETEVSFGVFDEPGTSFSSQSASLGYEVINITPGCSFKLGAGVKLKTANVEQQKIGIINTSAKVTATGKLEDNELNSVLKEGTEVPFDEGVFDEPGTSFSSQSATLGNTLILPGPSVPIIKATTPKQPGYEFIHITPGCSFELEAGVKLKPSNIKQQKIGITRSGLPTGNEAIKRKAPSHDVESKLMTVEKELQEEAEEAEGSQRNSKKVTLEKKLEFLEKKRENRNQRRSEKKKIKKMEQERKKRERAEAAAAEFKTPRSRRTCLPYDRYEQYDLYDEWDDLKTKFPY